MMMVPGVIETRTPWESVATDGRDRVDATDESAPERAPESSSGGGVKST